jgi:hypothetical protein
MSKLPVFQVGTSLTAGMKTWLGGQPFIMQLLANYDKATRVGSIYLANAVEEIRSCDKVFLQAVKELFVIRRMNRSNIAQLFGK